MTEITISNGREPEKLSDKGGFFDLVVRPMFQSGHEGELHSWLKDMGLIRSSYRCPNGDCDGRNLVWNVARVVDRFSWKCPHCSKTQAIRDDSFFFGIKCDLKIALQLILAWCQNIPLKDATAIMDSKDFIVKKVYEKCTKIADNWFKNHKSEYSLGGPGKVIIIDEYPGDIIQQKETIENIQSRNNNNRKRNNNYHTILCVIEINNIPPKMLFHITQTIPDQINKNDDINSDIKKYDNNNIDETIDIINKHILPGSLLVVNKYSKWINYNSICELNDYQTFCIDYLEKFDTNGTKNLRDNLGIIWQSAVDICEEIQETTKAQGQKIISSYLWRQKFFFQNMLHQIAEEYRFT